MGKLLALALLLRSAGPSGGLELRHRLSECLNVKTIYQSCWLAEACILLLLLLLELVCAAAAYGSTATVAKTEEELEDRHQSLFGDADSADDIKITMPSKDQANGENVSGAHLNGEAGTNGQIPTQTHNGTDGQDPPNVSLHCTWLTHLTKKK